MPEPDLIDTILDITPESPLGRLRVQRPDIRRHTQGSYDVLLHPADPGGLSLAERALIALRVAEQAGHAGLAAHYRALLQQRDTKFASAPSPRLRRILDHVALVAGTPGKATRAHIEALERVGLNARDIVALSQLIAFVSYQVRAAFGLALLKESAA